MLQPKIVVLDGYTLNPGDISWTALEALGTTEIYEESTPSEAIVRGKDADILIINKLDCHADFLRQFPRLKCICLSATGYNNVDLEAASAQGIVVCNAVAYGTESVAQHVFALLLTLTNQVMLHHQSVQSGDWARCQNFSYHLQPIIELSGKTMGIYGFGRIGQQVATIAEAFGMQVLATHKHPKRDARPNVQFVSIETLFTQSDVISLHAPLSVKNRYIVNRQLFQLMQPTAYLINTGRGGLVHEADLKEALASKQLAGAALDVLNQEPPPLDHILMNVPNCIITPHQAWASKSARERLMNITIANVRAFLAGAPQNCVT
ncbi:MAG: D-2-hydroxyacid dehydrogenase [Bacteroidota bacterium]